LIVWDRLFGTFAEEQAEDPPVYGITKNIETFSPVRIAFHEWAALWGDVRRAPGLLNKLKYVFAPFSHDAVDAPGPAQVPQPDTAVLVGVCLAGAWAAWRLRGRRSL